MYRNCSWLRKQIHISHSFRKSKHNCCHVSQLCRSNCIDWAKKHQPQILDEIMKKTVEITLMSIFSMRNKNFFREKKLRFQPCHQSKHCFHNLWLRLIWNIPIWLHSVYTSSIKRKREISWKPSVLNYRASNRCHLLTSWNPIKVKAGSKLAVFYFCFTCPIHQSWTRIYNLYVKC